MPLLGLELKSTRATLLCFHHLYEKTILQAAPALSAGTQMNTHGAESLPSNPTRPRIWIPQPVPITPAKLQTPVKEMLIAVQVVIKQH